MMAMRMMSVSIRITHIHGTTLRRLVSKIKSTRARRERERERERQTDRQTGRQTDRQTDRQTETGTERDRHTERDQAVQ